MARKSKGNTGLFKDRCRVVSDPDEITWTISRSHPTKAIVPWINKLLRCGIARDGVKARRMVARRQL